MIGNIAHRILCKLRHAAYALKQVCAVGMMSGANGIWIPPRP
jgi:hypothetical protein